MNIFIFFFIILYFKLGLKLNKYLINYINSLYFKEIRHIDNFTIIKLKSKGEIKLKKINLFLKILIFFYKILNPFMYFLEIFIPKFYFFIRILNNLSKKYNISLNFIYEFIIFFLLNPIIRFMILYFYIKIQFFKQH